MAESTASPAAPVADAPVEVLSAVPSRLASEAVETPAGSGTQTPTVELTPEERVNSVNVSLADLAAKGQAKYGQKQYEEAAEIFSQAAEMQAELNGEMAPENAEILFHYGRALFKVGQSKSDVLGGKAPAAGGASGAEKAAGKKKGGENGVAKKAKKEEAAAAEAKDEQQKTAEEGGEKATGRASKADDALEAKKPLFQFTGDENFDDSEEEEEEEGEEEEDEEYDDLAAAFEVLEMARVLFRKKLELEEASQKESEGKGKEASGGDAPSIRHIKERLADTHDLLAEISLENEKYHSAIVDSRESLKFKQELYPEESEIVAEAHFKLSLALEFASVTSSDEDKDGKPGLKPVDQDLRDEAARELEAAIASTRLKLRNKEVELATNHSSDDNDLTRKQIADVKEIIADMEQRLVDLKNPPIDVNEALYGPSGIVGSGNTLGGVLGAALGESAEQKQARVEEAKKAAKDLTGLVRKKQKAEPQPTADSATTAAPAASGLNGNGKRRAEEEPTEAAPEESKKARVEDAAE